MFQSIDRVLFALHWASSRQVPVLSMWWNFPCKRSCSSKLWTCLRNSLLARLTKLEIEFLPIEWRRRRRHEARNEISLVTLTSTFCGSLAPPEELIVVTQAYRLMDHGNVISCVNRLTDRSMSMPGGVGWESKLLLLRDGWDGRKETFAMLPGRVL